MVQYYDSRGTVRRCYCCTGRDSTLVRLLVMIPVGERVVRTTEQVSCWSVAAMTELIERWRVRRCYCCTGSDSTLVRLLVMIPVEGRVVRTTEQVSCCSAEQMNNLVAGAWLLRVSVVEEGRTLSTTESMRDWTVCSCRFCTGVAASWGESCQNN